MKLEPYWLQKPRPTLTGEQRDSLRSVQIGSRRFNENLEASGLPKWLYLDWLAQHRHIVFHGSGVSGIERFEPRTPHDDSPDDFSKQTAVFASDDAIWALFHAVLNRPQPGLRVLSSAFQVVQDSSIRDSGIRNSELNDMHYFFSVTRSVLDRGAWREGVVYILPKEPFVQMPSYDFKGRRVLEPHWAALEHVLPLGEVRVGPGDFPFLSQVRGHDNGDIMRRAAADPYGFPWLDGVR